MDTEKKNIIVEVEGYGKVTLTPKDEEFIQLTMDVWHMTREETIKWGLDGGLIGRGF